RIIELLLNRPGISTAKANGTLATDFSQTIVSAKKFPQEGGKPIVFKFKYFDENETAPSANAKEYTVKIDHTGTVNPADLLAYLRYPSKQSSLSVSDRNRTITALNIVASKFANESGRRLLAFPERGNRSSKFFVKDDVLK